jgi:4-hydroxybenzoate polyprenyltransferase
MLLACGFVIRAIAGGVAIAAHVSNWLLLCTFLLALFLALCKRRQEIVVLEKNAIDHRPVLAEYSEPFIDSLISVITGATVVSYALYTVSPEVIRKLGTDKLIFTLPFVLYGIFRYLYLMHQKDLGDNPTEVLFKDFSLQLGILGWLAVCFILIYFRM